MNENRYELSIWSGANVYGTSRSANFRRSRATRAVVTGCSRSNFNKEVSSARVRMGGIGEGAWRFLFFMLRNKTCLEEKRQTSSSKSSRLPYVSFDLSAKAAPLASQFWPSNGTTVMRCTFCVKGWDEQTVKISRVPVTPSIEH